MRFSEEFYGRGGRVKRKRASDDGDGALQRGQERENDGHVLCAQLAQRPLPKKMPAAGGRVDNFLLFLYVNTLEIGH